MFDREDFYRGLVKSHDSYIYERTTKRYSPEETADFRVQDLASKIANVIGNSLMEFSVLTPHLTETRFFQKITADAFSHGVSMEGHFLIPETRLRKMMLSAGVCDYAEPDFGLDIPHPILCSSWRNRPREHFDPSATGATKLHQDIEMELVELIDHSAKVFHEVLRKICDDFPEFSPELLNMEMDYLMESLTTNRYLSVTSAHERLEFQKNFLEDPKIIVRQIEEYHHLRRTRLDRP